MGGILAFLLYGLLLVVGITSLVCFIMVLIKMFEKGEQTMGIVVIVLTVCGGIGGLVAFVLGWVNATKWNIKNIMLIWTAAIVASLVLYAVIFATVGMAVMNDPDLQQFN